MRDYELPVKLKSTNLGTDLLNGAGPMEKSIPKNILLVDDNQGFLTVLAGELSGCCNNFCILTAENGEKALKVLESAHVDLVVTDLHMPVMDGFGLLSHMNKKYPGIPAIVMSSFLDPELESRLKALGVSRSIDKKLLSISVLEETILETLGLPHLSTRF